MAASLLTYMVAGTGFITIILAIPLNAFLSLDFTLTIMGTFAFHDRFSFATETAPRFPTGLYGLQADDTTFALVFLLGGSKYILAV